MLSDVVVAVVAEGEVYQCVALAVAVAAELRLSEQQGMVCQVLFVLEGVAVDGCEDFERAVGCGPHERVGEDQPLVHTATAAHHKRESQQKY